MYSRVRAGMRSARSWKITTNERTKSDKQIERAHLSFTFKAHRSNSYARSRARVAGWKPLTKRMRGILVRKKSEFSNLSTLYLFAQYSHATYSHCQVTR